MNVDILQPVISTKNVVDAVMLLNPGDFKVAVTVTVQRLISRSDCEFTENVFALGVAAGVVIVNQLFTGVGLIVNE